MLSFRAVKERKIAQWALAYLAGAWALLEVADLIGGRFGWPDVWLRSLIVVLGIGFIAALILAWYHGEKGQQKVSTIELGMLTVLLVLAGVGVGLVGASTAPATDEDGSPADASRLATDAVRAEQGSIAVLPFADLSPGSDQEYFSDGLTEELLNVLSQLPELRVASRTSAFAFKEKDVGIDSIARALNVNHVLEGSVRKAGNEVRITAQLIDTSTGYHLWSKTYDRELEDVFAVQDEISRAIVDALEVELGGERATGRLARTETRDPEAHTLVLRGLHFKRLGTPEGTERAIELFRQATLRDPSYARAYAEMGDVLALMAYQFPDSRAERIEEARTAVERALTLDPTLAQGHFAMGTIAWIHDGEMAAAEAHFRRAIELNPGSALSHSRLGWVLVVRGRTGEAVAAARRAAELDPVAGGILNNLGAVYTYADRPHEAVEAFEAALEVNPEAPTTASNLALSYADVGDLDEAVAMATRAVEQAPRHPFTLSVLAYVQGQAGQLADAERTIRTLQGVEPDAYLLAMAYAGLGARDRVFELLERAVTEQDPSAHDLAVDPVFDAYRDDPRMVRLLERLGAADAKQ